MKTESPNVIYLKDYTKPAYLIKDIHLTFDLDDTKTVVTAKSSVIKNEQGNLPLVLNGEELKLLSIKINDKLVSDSDFSVENNLLTINVDLEEFTLEIINEVNPVANKALDGLYKSSGIFCTQNEPEGFRRITYYIDRPDNMAVFTTKVIANKKQYPILLSNGNPVDSGDLENGKHFVEWLDPFPKPSYLYALVAGDLEIVKDTFKTISGRSIALEIYCDKGNAQKCLHAMESLKKSMTWDEEVYGREYDLDIYMIVAVDSFNMGAMENKGLNIFNSVYVLANEKTATDNDFLGIESVIGHEYFHNWTGNRITCRDWFQLTLKEGLTVFRDQEFSADLNSRAVQRISDVNRLRSYQFIEDAGPTSHPIRPPSYIEINNFYTSTVYEKGAEIIRMIHTLLGKEGYRKGTDKYFELFDGQAVTTEDFLHALSIANNNFDFTQFSRWYNQSGTPLVKCNYSYDENNKNFTINIKQDATIKNSRPDNQPYYFPLQVGLVDSAGNDLDLSVKSSDQHLIDRGILIISKEEESFTFENINEHPVPSINRNFSAPIKLELEIPLKQQTFLMANDNDAFNRFEAGRYLAKRNIFNIIEKKEVELEFITSIKTILLDESIDDEFKALCIELPDEQSIHQDMEIIDYIAAHEARESLANIIAATHKGIFVDMYAKLIKNSDTVGKRSLKSKVVNYLARLNDESIFDLIFDEFKKSTNMTDEISTFKCLVHFNNAHSKEASESFYNKWKHETLVMQKWLSCLSSSPGRNTIEVIKDLENLPEYDQAIPNLVRSLVICFVATNFHNFHDKSGSGYEYASSKILELDSVNPQVASRIVSSFKDYKRVSETNRKLMKPHLEKIKSTVGISKNVFEIVNKILS